MSLNSITDRPAILAAMSGLRIACAGDVMLDRFIAGSVERISPEAPVPVLRVSREHSMLGGAGNVVRNLVALGVSVDFAGVISPDAAGDTVRSLCGALQDVRFELIVDPARPTTEKVRYLSANQQIMRADRESATSLPNEVRKALIATILGRLPGSAALILSDYAKGALADNVAAELISRARELRVPIVVDPKGGDYRRYAGATVATPNRKELAEALGHPLAPGEETECARRLIDDCGLAAVLVTLGRDGALLVTDDDAILIAAEIREVFDVAGAGDTVAAVLAAALGTGASLAEAAALANLAAGLVVSKPGTAVATAAEITDALRRRTLDAGSRKIASLPAITERTESWRRQGLRIGFTNGCFDLIHPGHVSLLEQAKASCDRLIVGLNSDASIARLKGPDRPVQMEAARALVLASLATVDAVVVFGEDTPLGLIKAIRPDVLVKGADYRLEQVVGADVVQGYGGCVVLARIEPGYSTTATIARLANA